MDNVLEMKAPTSSSIIEGDCPELDEALNELCKHKKHYGTLEVGASTAGPASGQLMIEPIRFRVGRGDSFHVYNGPRS